MPYIGRDNSNLSNVEVLDNITFDGSSSYTLQKGGVNFTPSSANNILISIDGVVQAGNFTVSSSTIDFGTAVAGTSTCDFILHYGTGLITTPADGTVTTAKLASGVGLPAGMVAPFGMSSAPTGWLECDGSAISRTTYATLFTAVGTTHGVGDGSTTFNLPDLRGEFIRGWDNGKGTDSGRSFASSQAEEVGTHNHTYLIKDGSSGTGNIAGFPESTLQYWSNATSGTTQNNSGSENRPRNIALMYCIKT